MKDAKTGLCIKIAMARSQVSGILLADELGVTPTTVTRWRREGCDSFETLKSISLALDYWLEEMLDLVAD